MPDKKLIDQLNEAEDVAGALRILAGKKVDGEVLKELDETPRQRAEVANAEIDKLNAESAGASTPTPSNGDEGAAPTPTTVARDQFETGTAPPPPMGTEVIKGHRDKVARQAPTPTPGSRSTPK